MKTALAVAFALVATSAFAAPAGYDRPGGYHDQVKAGSLSKPVDACPVAQKDRDPARPELCATKPKPPTV